MVGHSFAGKVVAAVADRAPEKVRRVLYLDAFRPQKDVRTPQGAFDPSEFGRLKPGEWTVPLTEEILDSVGKDVKGPDRRWMLSKATPWPVKHSSEPVTLSKNFDSVKSAYILLHRRRRPRRRDPERKVGKARRPLQGHRVRALANDHETRGAGAGDTGTRLEDLGGGYFVLDSLHPRVKKRVMNQERVQKMRHEPIDHSCSKPAELPLTRFLLSCHKCYAKLPTAIPTR